jgi:peroxiredoxin Q/BCP
MCSFGLKPIIRQISPALQASSQQDRFTRMRFRLATLSLLLLCAALSAANPDDFTVRAAAGKGSFTLKEARGKYVALHFLLKTECPVCLRHTHDYFAKADTLPNVVQVFLKPDSDSEIEAWAAKLPEGDLAKYPIYRDPYAKYTKAFDIPDGYQFHGQKVHYPALVLLDPEGKEVFRYVGKSNSDRFSFEQLKAKVEELSKN